MKSFLIIVLAVSQLLSWSASPIYLCQCDCGSVCVDAGPENCSCCQETCHNHDSCVADEEEGCQAHRAPGIRAAGVRAHSCDAAIVLLKNRDCDCRHVLLIGSQAPFVVVSGSGAKTFESLAVAFDFGWSGAAVAFVVAREVDPHLLRLGCAPPRDLSMADAGPVVLRC